MQSNIKHKSVHKFSHTINLILHSLTAINKEIIFFLNVKFPVSYHLRFIKIPWPKPSKSVNDKLMPSSDFILIVDNR